MTAKIDPTGAGSSWDSATAAERVVRAYSAPDLVAIRTGQIDLLDPQPGWRILDAGCGPGIFAVDLARRGAHVTALDSAPSMLEAAAELAVRAGVAVEVAEGDAEAIPFADATFDAATLVQVLEYLGDPVLALRELARVVRPGGCVLAADTDWDTMAFAIEDLGLARRVALAWADGKACGQAGRRIPGWLVAAGIEPEETRPPGAALAERGRRHVPRAQLAVLPPHDREEGAHARPGARPLRAPDGRGRRRRPLPVRRRAARLARPRPRRCPMIVRPVDDRAELVMQVDHAVLSGELAEAWGGDAVAPLAPRESVILAARLHDAGWRGWESAPVLDAAGRPTNFLQIDVREHLVFYRAGVEDVLARDRHAGMLVAKHAAGIYTGRYGTQPAMLLSRAPEQQAAVDAFIAEMEALYGGLQAELGVADDAFWTSYLLLQVFDRLSLWLCKGDPAGTGRMEILLPGERTLVIEPVEGGATLDPWPLAAPAVTLAVPTRVVPLAGYADDAALQAAIAAAPLEQRPVTLRPPG